MIMEENLGKILEESMKSLKRNNKVWDDLCAVKKDEDVLVI